MAILKLKEICKTYVRGGFFQSKEHLDALVDVSLTIDEKMCLGLVGESGCGKSTLARIALGLEAPDSGTVSFMGSNPGNGKPSPTLRRNLQVVFQDCFNSVNPRFTVAKIISEPLRNFERLTSRQERRQTAGLLETVGLKPENAEKYPHQLSGGELQRVCIARAIALKPRLIVMDEAVSSLDMLTQARILELLTNLRQSFNTTYLFITHDIRLVPRICDCLAVMHKGRIVDFSDDLETLGKLSHPASKKLLSSVLPVYPADGPLAHSGTMTAPADPPHFIEPRTKAEPASGGSLF